MVQLLYNALMPCMQHSSPVLTVMPGAVELGMVPFLSISYVLFNNCQVFVPGQGGNRHINLPVLTDCLVALYM